MNETPKDITSRRVTRFGTSPRQNGPAIRALREKDGYSQAALAGLAGIRQATLSDIETEQASAALTTLNRLARHLCVPVAAIMRDVADPADEEPGQPESDELQKRRGLKDNGSRIMPGPSAPEDYALALPARAAAGRAAS